ncbi:hypothetical protein EYF80_055275 [Liparis tanakae]|uniref:Uncharacterized protein n=1 Tax=Liparis tanakae TaxID=230148 RepID=A0A4Z2F1B8_9TELE|nr:hypothetical protein EYF80_055275 [Liparis tanakae]
MKSCATKLPIQIDFVAEVTQPSSGGETGPPPPGSHRRARGPMVNRNALNATASHSDAVAL